MNKRFSGLFIQSLIGLIFLAVAAGHEIKEKWKTLINTYNVKAIVAGHFHRDELHWLGDVPVYIAPPVAGYWGRKAAFRIY
ncbi:MAG: hypothetical protein SWH61_16705 [Thermodesulfobacteriota bacterium]|nr:hypothetical protein [Thermodesulfobacteriota bacterium]